MMSNSLIQVRCQLDPDINIESVTKRLPTWKTVVTLVKLVDGDLPVLQVKLMVAANTVEKVLQWLEEFQEKTKTTYPIRSTEKCLGRYVSFKQRRYCHHNTACKRVYNPSVKGRTKNTNCPSKMMITLRNVDHHHPHVTSEAPDPEFPCEIDMIATHNHSVDTPDVLRFRRVSTDVKEMLIDLYNKGHTPATALKVVKKKIRLKYRNRMDILSDRKYCPDYRYCYYLYVKVVNNEVDELSDGDVTEEEQIEEEMETDVAKEPDEALTEELIELVVENDNKSDISHEDAVIRCRDVLEEFVQMVTPVFELSPQEVRPALETFKKRALLLTTTSAMASALSEFGSESP